MADKLIIGDTASVKLRDEGRKEFEENESKELLKHLKDSVECPTCPYDSPDCEGPNIEDTKDEGTKIIWSCSQQECPCCNTDMDVNEFETDLEGKVTL